MKKYQIEIGIIDKDYADQLITALVRQGYNVFFNQDDNVVCFNVTNEELTEIECQKIKK